jgi:DMSO reductase anchor subunit
VAIHGGPDVSPAFLLGLSVAAALLVLAGELVERHLFFVAASAPRMPGELP